MAVSKSASRRYLPRRLLPAAGRGLAVGTFAMLSLSFLAAAPPAGAAGLLDWLFKPKAEQVRPVERPRVQPIRPLLPKITPSEGVERRAPTPGGSSSSGAKGSGGYQTMCVRLCDGYYWPVRYGVSSRDMRKDRQFCASSCHAESELFYRPTDSFDVANMRDLSGRPYKKLANAFRYRENFDPACRCQEEPWSRASQWRHSSYAMAEQKLLPDDGLKAASWNTILAVEPTDRLIVSDGVSGSGTAVAAAALASDIPSVAVSPDLAAAGQHFDFELDAAAPEQPTPAKSRNKPVARKASSVNLELANGRPLIDGVVKSSGAKSAGAAKLATPARPAAAIPSWLEKVYRAGKR